MQVSKFGQRFTRNTGARELMDDLGAALAGDHPVMMLGGGNPAHIPAVVDVFRARLREVMSDERAFQRMFGNYADPTGEIKFRTALAGLRGLSRSRPMASRFSPSSAAARLRSLI